MTRVADLFVLSYGHSLELNRLKVSEEHDAVCFVSRTARNNGVSARIERILDLEPAPAGSLTVALGGQGGAGTAFLQPYPYYCGRDVMILTPKTPMSEQEKLWWATCITANRFRFGFGRQANRTLKDLELPDISGVPTWAHSIAPDNFDDVSTPADNHRVELRKFDSWTEYPLQQLFDIRKGKRLEKASMVPGQIPFIGAIDGNNGVSGAVSEAIHEGNTITINYNGSVAEAFYQSVPFWASDDVNVLYPRFNLTPEAALFVCAVIRLERFRFSYGRKWHLERMRHSTVRLPATRAGTPDWEYMKKYIRSLPFSSQI